MAQAVDIPVVAIGGVTDLADVLDFLAVGAVAVQVGTAIFADPTLPVRLVDELEAECRRRGLDEPIGTSSGRPCRSGPARRPSRASSTGRDAGSRPATSPARPARRLRRVTTIQPALDIAARRPIAPRTEALFRPSGAFREGHFLLKSGRHGDAYLEKFQVLQDPAATSELCGFWAAHVRGRDGAPMVDLVAGPDDRRRHPRLRDRAPARRPGRSSPRRSAATTARPHREFRRGFRIEPGERVLLVDDILTTGGSLLAMLPAVEAMGGEIVDCVVLVDRSGGRATLTSPTTGRTYPLRSLWQLDLPTYEPGAATCPRCADGTPLYAPGSTGTGAGRRTRPGAA